LETNLQCAHLLRPGFASLLHLLQFQGGAAVLRGIGSAANASTSSCCDRAQALCATSGVRLAIANRQCSIALALWHQYCTGEGLLAWQHVLTPNRCRFVSMYASNSELSFHEADCRRLSKLACFCMSQLLSEPFAPGLLATCRLLAEKASAPRQPPTPVTLTANPPSPPHASPPVSPAWQEPSPHLRRVVTTHPAAFCPSLTSSQRVAAAAAAAAAVVVVAALLGLQ
jgi:hypothetical protein